MTAQIGFLPPVVLADLTDHIESAQHRDRDPGDPDGRYALERLMERTFAAGFDAGYRRGNAAGRETARRAYEVRSGETAKQDGTPTSSTDRSAA